MGYDLAKASPFLLRGGGCPSLAPSAHPPPVLPRKGGGAMGCDLSQKLPLSP